MVQATPVRDNVCHACPAHTFQSAAAHALTECDTQESCASGTFLQGASSSTVGVCVECPENTFMNGEQHRNEQCLPQPTCTIGQFYDFNGKSVSAGCDACPAQTYQPTTAHRTQSCTAQAPCGNGTFYAAAADSASERECTVLSVGFLSLFFFSIDSDGSWHTENILLCARCSVCWVGGGPFTAAAPNLVMGRIDGPNCPCTRTCTPRACSSQLQLYSHLPCAAGHGCPPLRHQRHWLPTG